MFFSPYFSLVKETCLYPSGVLLQDPPVSQARLPCFNSFVPFFPAVRKLRVASCINRFFVLGARIPHKDLEGKVTLP